MLFYSLNTNLGLESRKDPELGLYIYLNHLQKGQVREFLLG